MPQNSHIIGVNSVTNMDWVKALCQHQLSEMRTGLESWLIRIADRVLCLAEISGGHFMRVDHCAFPFIG